LPNFSGKKKMDDTAPLQWRVDLHVHTRRYSPCAESLDPEMLPAVITAMGLDGVVITEHDHLWSPLEIAALTRHAAGPRIFRGVEVSSRNGHFLVVGLDWLDAFHPGMSIQNLVRQARRQDAAVVWAHPQLTYSHTRSPLDFVSLPDGIDAIEVASTVTVGSQAAEVMAYARAYGYSTVGGSDAHALAQVGKAFTCLDHLPADEKELAAAIRSGRCAAGVHPLGRAKPRRLA
jgi:predicted metal-dependent phosphoesterase TrpH